MASLLQSAVLLVLSPDCYHEFFVNLNFLHVACLKSAISKGLGYGIILGSLLVKLPQILKICGNKSGEGISLMSVLLELFAITATVSYSFMNRFPFSAWGEGLFLSLQTLTVGALVLHYSGRSSRALVFVLIYSVVVSILVSGMTPMKVLWSLQACNVPVVISGKMMQALANYRNSSTGQLSAATVYMLFFGSMARVFTSVQETGDTIVVLTYVSATLANGIIAAQIIYYGLQKKEKKKAA